MSKGKKKKFRALFLFFLMAAGMFLLTGSNKPAQRDQFLILVNKEYTLNEEYKPEELVNIAKLVPATKEEILLDPTAAKAYQYMLEDMKRDGVTDIYAVSGYRTYQYQSNLYRNQIARYSYLNYNEATARAGQVVAPPGASEHQTGLALDISAKSVGYSLSASFENTDTYKWLLDNCSRYGFIIRYFPEKTNITGIIYEPWHIRYVGVEHAEKIMFQDLCLEEYLMNMAPVNDSMGGEWY